MAIGRFDKDDFHHDKVYDYIYAKKLLELIANKEKVAISLDGNEKKFVLIKQDSKYIKTFKDAIQNKDKTPPYYTIGINPKVKGIYTTQQYKDLCKKYKSIIDKMFIGTTVENNISYIILFRFVDIAKQDIKKIVTGKSSTNNAYGKELADAGELATILSLTDEIKCAKDTKQDFFKEHEDAFNSWKNTFTYTKKHVKDIMKNKPISQYDIVHDATDKGHNITKKINKISKEIGFANKNSYNPSDIYIVKKSLTNNQKLNKKFDRLFDFAKLAKDKKTFAKQMNTFMYSLYQKNFYYPISLKKLDETGMGHKEFSNVPNQKCNTYFVSDFSCEMKIDGSTKEIGGITITVSINGDEKKDTITMQFRPTGKTGVGPITFEITKITSAKSGGRIGKIPKDLIKPFFTDTKFSSGYSNIYTKALYSYDFWSSKPSKGNIWLDNFFKKETSSKEVYDMLKYVVSHMNSGVFSLSLSSASLKIYNNIKNKYSDFKKYCLSLSVEQQKNLSLELQGIVALFFLLKNEKDISYIITQFINGAKKEGALNGFFIKIY